MEVPYYWHDEPPLIPLGRPGWAAFVTTPMPDWMEKAAVDMQNMTAAMLKAAEAHAGVAALAKRVAKLEKRRRRK